MLVLYRHEAESAIVYLLNQIAGGTMTKEQVEANSACWCFTGITYNRVVAYLLAQIAAGGGGGGGSTNPVYTGAAPPAAPAFPLQGALFTPDADGAPLQKWIPGTGWVVI